MSTSLIIAYFFIINFMFSDFLQCYITYHYDQCFHFQFLNFIIIFKFPMKIKKEFYLYLYFLKYYYYNLYHYSDFSSRSKLNYCFLFLKVSNKNFQCRFLRYFDQSMGLYLLNKIK